MNYRHIYHAGHFADVMKHVILLAMLESLKLKESAFCYLDTHAGSGIYDLTTDRAKKTNEAANGIYKVWQAPSPPPLIQTYLASIAMINKKYASNLSDQATLQHYPGSPLFAKSQLRPSDRAILCELEEGEYTLLNKIFSRDKQVAVHHQDGLLGLKAYLPPKEKRGLILMDSPFEKPDEFTELISALNNGLGRFANGIYAIWYPIKDKMINKRFHYNLKNSVKNEILIIELSIYPEKSVALTGSGMAIINPPWQLKESLQSALSWLWKTLTINDQGDVSLFFLK